MIIALVLCLLVVEPNPLDGRLWQTFDACMAGPGRGCHGSYYKRDDCEQFAGTAVVCRRDWIYPGQPYWTCEHLHPRCLRWDLDFDNDVDLRDYAIDQRKDGQQ